MVVIDNSPLIFFLLKIKELSKKKKVKLRAGTIIVSALKN